MTDEEILALFNKRDERAILETEAKYGALLRRIARNVLKNDGDAEEAVSDALLALWQSIPPEKPESLRAYAAGAVKRRALSLCRKKMALKRASSRLELTDELDECIPARADAESGLEAAELSAAITAWLRTLDKEDRVLFVRRYWYGDPVKELARETGSAPQRLAKRLFRLRGRLKKHLEKEGYSI